MGSGLLAATCPQQLPAWGSHPPALLTPLPCAVMGLRAVLTPGSAWLDSCPQGAQQAPGTWLSLSPLSACARSGRPPGHRPPCSHSSAWGVSGLPSCCMSGACGPERPLGEACPLSAWATPLRKLGFQRPSSPAALGARGPSCLSLGPPPSLRAAWTAGEVLDRRGLCLFGFCVTRNRADPSQPPPWARGGGPLSPWFLNNVWHQPEAARAAHHPRGVPRVSLAPPSPPSPPSSSQGVRHQLSTNNSYCPPASDGH